MQFRSFLYSCKILRFYPGHESIYLRAKSNKSLERRRIHIRSSLKSCRNWRCLPPRSIHALGSRKEVEHIHTIIERGTSADEQLKVWEDNNQDFKPVVDMLIKNTMENVPANN